MGSTAISGASPMVFEQLTIEGPLVIRPSRHGNTRGWFSETFRLDKFVDAAGDQSFVQHNQSVSASWEQGTVETAFGATGYWASGFRCRRKCVAGIRWP